MLATGDPAHCVFGVVFEIAAAEKEHLDRIEGLGSAMPRNGCGWLLPMGRSWTPSSIARPRIDAALAPFAWYQAHVLAGARQHGLPADYVRAIEAVTVIDDPDPARARRELAIY